MNVPLSLRHQRKASRFMARANLHGMQLEIQSGSLQFQHHHQRRALSSSYFPLRKGMTIRTDTIRIFNATAANGTRKRPRTNTNFWHRGFSSTTTTSHESNKEEEPQKPPRWLRRLQKKAASNKPMDSQRAYQYLKLEKYSEDELKNRFHAILESGMETTVCQESSTCNEDPKPSLNQATLQLYLTETIRQKERERDEILNAGNDSSEAETNHIDWLRNEYIQAETQQLWKFLNPNETATTAISESEFVDRLTKEATSLDKQRLWPLTLSMVMIGLSVGVTTPAFPFVVQNLGLTTGEYGMVVSAFALTKLMGNIPFAVLVERNGRKPYLVYSLIAISTGVGCIGLASGFEELYVARLVTGLGVAGLSCAATMSVTDISTPLNRASSFAPISAGFAAGTAMGPALGGVLIDGLGVNSTFYLVGGSFMMLGGVNSILLDETMKKPHAGFPWQQKSIPKTADTSTTSSSSSNDNNDSNDADDDDKNNDSIQQAFSSALGQWVPLLSEAPVRNVCIINAFYWVALSGGQMTLLPLLLTDPTGLAMTATQVGYVYMGMSFVQVLGNPLFARVVDNVGTVPGIVGGCTLISASMYSLPFCSDNMLYMGGVLGLWAAGSSLLSTSPIAHIGNTVDDSKRAQAIALLRTAGDVGFLVGASSMGMVSDWAGSLETAMQSSAAILGTATSWYVARNLMTSAMESRK